MASPIWRYLTHPDGMTVSQLSQATGMTAPQVRAELRALEAAGKAVREAGRPGQEHRWWQRGCQPLGELSIMVVMMLARVTHRSPRDLCAALKRAARRAKHRAQRNTLAVVTASKDPHRAVDRAFCLYEIERGTLGVPRVRGAE